MGRPLRLGLLTLLGGLLGASAGELFPPAAADAPPPAANPPAAVAKRLADAGAGTGDVQVVLLWDNAAPPPLVCEDPSGAVLDADGRASPSGGAYVTAPGTAGGWATGGLAAATWPSGHAPEGRYKVYVAGPPRGGAEATPFVCVVKASGGVEQFSAAADAAGRKQQVYEFVQRAAPAAGPWRRAAGDGTTNGLLALGLMLGLLGVSLGAPPARAPYGPAVAAVAAAAAGFTLGAGADWLWDLCGRPASASAAFRVGGWLALGAGLGGVLQAVARGPAPWRGPTAGAAAGLLGAGLREGGALFLPPLATRLAAAAGFGLAFGLGVGALALPGARRAPARAAGGAGLHLPTGRVIPLAAGVVLTAADLPGVAAGFLRRAVARVAPKPDNPAVLGITNLSRGSWSVRLPGGASAQVPPGRSVRVAPGVRIDFGPFAAEVR